MTRSKRAFRIGCFVAFLFAFVTMSATVQMHPAYKDLPAWFVDYVWRPVILFMHGV